MDRKLKTILKGKKILFIGASGHFELALKRAKQLGAYTICINYNKNAMAKKYADFSADIDTYNPDEVLDFAKKQEIDGVFTSWNEVNLYTAEYVAKKMGLPFYATKEQLDALITKYAFKQTCRKFNVPIIQEFYVGNDLSNKEISQFEYPVIFKPIDSGGTRGMTILYSDKGIKEASKKALDVSIKKEFIVEKYLRQGQLIVIDFIIQKGNVYVASVADRVITRTSENEVPLSIAFFYPSKNIDIVYEQILGPIKEMISKLNIYNGIISFEGMISDGKVYLIESQFRFGGTHFYTLMEQEYNIDLLGMMLAYSVSGMFDFYAFDEVSPYFDHMYACQNLQANSGIVKTIENYDAILKIPGVTWAVQIKNLGDCIPADGSTAVNFAKIGILGENEKEIYGTMNAVQNTLIVLDDKGNNLIKKNIPPEYIV